MHFVCLFYKGKESITTRTKKGRPGSFMSSYQQEGQHTESLEKIKQADPHLWSRRKKTIHGAVVKGAKDKTMIPS